MKIKKQIKKILSDKIVIKYQYYKTFGKIANLKNPQTFSEKIQWIKLNGNLEKVSNLVDKYLVRDFVKNKIGEEHLIKLYGVYDNIEEIDFKNLPNRFVIKDTHGCGSNFICKDKKNLDKVKLKKITDDWFSKNFYTETRERQYKNCDHKLIIEEYLEDRNGELNDYKFFCLGGKVRVIEVDIDRFGDLKRDYYDINWNKINLRKAANNSDIKLDKPKDLKKMVDYAEKLSEGIELLRVDFYYVDDNIFFGELTFTPASGLTPFEPELEDLKLASYVDLNKYKLGENDEY